MSETQSKSEPRNAIQTFSLLNTSTPACSKLETSTQASNRPTQTCRLLALPSELKDMIIENVTALRDLSNLSKTCFDLREATLPMLFRNLDLDLSKSWAPGLLQVLAEHEEYPPLGEMVRKMYIRATRLRERHAVLECIHNTPKLTRLEIYYQLDEAHPKAWECIDGKALSFGLANVKSTLTHLKISYDLYTIDFTDPPTKGFCSLQALHKLESVDIPFFVLLGWLPGKAPSLADVLPHSLSVLKFGDDDWYDEKFDDGDEECWNETCMMRTFTKYFGGFTWEKTTPNLKLVIFSLKGYDGTQVSDWRRNGGQRIFEQLCHENGLKCKVIRGERYLGTE
ncbi:hypothetical protein P154DRAFT_621570 [Amniculicola lignicola CBS 123094]|uniref:F-box domain-containing protein n=1 Tax=Amniculicola lignicola CBS 123094 TaxID=1392246 RepID=A0A6A5WAE4_9PLEO|nr:hypothetical protein P154DRAFT_621570 [Amniculicola lignicola CBS 123094]